MKIDRRNFLFGSAAASLVTRRTCDVRPPRTRVAGDKPNLAVIGMGMYARWLLPQFMDQGIVVAGICDVDRVRRYADVRMVEDCYRSCSELTVAAGQEERPVFKTVDGALLASIEWRKALFFVFHAARKRFSICEMKGIRFIYDTEERKEER